MPSRLDLLHRLAVPIIAFCLIAIPDEATPQPANDPNQLITERKRKDMSAQHRLPCRSGISLVNRIVVTQ